MAGTMRPWPEERSGKLVSLEGDTDIISTQLRLLPPSQKILILPSPLLENLSAEPEEDGFDAEDFVQEVFTVLTERVQTARYFLKFSTTSHPRLVFMNGGTVGAQAACITKISEHITDGDTSKAEEIFKDIVKDGIAGLMRRSVHANGKVEQAQLPTYEREETIREMAEDSRPRAVKAADSLDKKCADFEAGVVSEEVRKSHGEVPVIEAPIGTMHMQGVTGRRSTSMELRLDGENVHTTQRGAFGTHTDDEIVRTVLMVPNHRTSLNEKRNTFGHSGEAGPSCNSSPGESENLNVIEDGNVDIRSPLSGSFISIPHTPNFEIGEACIVDMHSPSPRLPLRKSQSADLSYWRNSSYLQPSLAKMLKHTRSVYHPRSPLSPSQIFEGSEALQTFPKPTFVRASQTTIYRSPNSDGSLKPEISSTQAAHSPLFVDRGTDPEVLGRESEEEPIARPFTPVFALTEDLVIFTDNGNKISDFIVQSYKIGSYPIVSPEVNVSPTLPEEYESSISPISVSRQDPEGYVPLARPPSHLTADTHDSQYTRNHEYHSYSFRDSYPPSTTRQWQRDAAIGVESVSTSIDPLTPSMTPSTPLNIDITHKFCELSPVHSSNAVGVQNSLRQLLNILFPKENGYTQHLYPVAPEANRLWKPVFRNEESSNTGNKGRTVDKIIALGCEDGVKEEFFHQISGQVERLGTKRDGLSRSGKLDIRYLISNVMQSFSSLSPATQNNTDPVFSSSVLAALLVPQIESFLATNPGIRLLILHYPYGHLATILAIRKLLGSDLFKIAGIIDSLASDPPPISSPRTSTKLHVLSNDAVESRTHNHFDSINRPRTNSLGSLRKQTSRTGSVHSSTASKAKDHDLDRVSFAEANLLLPSTATDSEITTFLSGIWRTLLEASSFYTPEAEPAPVVVERRPLTPTPKSAGSGDREPNYQLFPNFKQSKINRLTGNSHPISPKRVHSTSTASSMKTSKTMNTVKERRLREEDKEWENFYIGDDDSEDDAYDRMILGRAMQMIAPEVRRKEVKTDKKKALKWLGLA